MDITKINYLIENYPSKGPAFIAKQLGVSKSTVVVYAKRLGLRMSKEAKSKLYQQCGNKPDNERPVDPSQFRIIKKPEIAYILGLIWADGHLNGSRGNQSIVFTTISEDWKELREVFQRTGKWREYINKSPNNPTWKERTNVMTNNRPLFELLDSLDYRSKDKAPSKVLQTIPEHLRHYWWRGYFDGDGGLYLSGDLRQLSFASCYDQDWSFVIDLLDRLGVKYSIIKRQSKKGHKSSCARITGYDKCKRLCDYLYQGYNTDRIGLKRKHDKYQYLIDNPCKSRRSHTPGVTFDKQRGKWKAYIWSNETNKLKSNLLVGFYLTEQEAVVARKNKMEEMGFKDRCTHKDYVYHADLV